MKVIKMIISYITIFVFTGIFYFIIECIWKQKISDWRMLVLGGVLSLIISSINNLFTYETDFLLQGLIGSLSITIAEASFGYQWNIIEKLNIWNYSDLPLSFVGGQINILFSLFAWLPLSMLSIYLCDKIEYIIFKIGNKPYYKIFGKVVKIKNKQEC